MIMTVYDHSCKTRIPICLVAALYAAKLMLRVDPPLPSKNVRENTRNCFPSRLWQNWFSTRILNHATTIAWSPLLGNYGVRGEMLMTCSRWFIECTETHAAAPCCSEGEWPCKWREGERNFCMCTCTKGMLILIVQTCLTKYAACLYVSWSVWEVSCIGSLLLRRGKHVHITSL